MSAGRYRAKQHLVLVKDTWQNRIITFSCLYQMCIKKRRIRGKGMPEFIHKKEMRLRLLEAHPSFTSFSEEYDVKEKRKHFLTILKIPCRQGGKGVQWNDQMQPWNLLPGSECTEIFAGIFQIVVKEAFHGSNAVQHLLRVIRWCNRELVSGITSSIQCR